jgi:glycosyltransferase involved in cell wall biosynthesis
MPLFSVIMPAYNASLYIEEAIYSILNQTEKDLELLICDDGSTDDTIEICNKIKLCDNRVKVFSNKKNIGNLKTTNFLFSKCQGEYIAIQDADDYSIPNRLEICISEFRNDKELGLRGTYFMVTDAILEPISCGVLPLTNEAIQEKLKKEVPPFLYASIVVKRELLQLTGVFQDIFNRKGYADLDWICRICEVTKVKNLKSITYFYRQHALHENSPKNLIAKHGAELIVEAHKQRLKGEKDFIASKNKLKIRKFIADLYTKKAEQASWSQKNKLALKLFYQSFIIFPFDIYVTKNLLKLFKMRIRNLI